MNLRDVKFFVFLELTETNANVMTTPENERFSAPSKLSNFTFNTFYNKCCDIWESIRSNSKTGVQTLEETYDNGNELVKNLIYNKMIKKG